MTGFTFLAQSQPRLLQRSPGFLLLLDQIGVGDELRLVTAFACYPVMFAHQRKTRLAMVKVGGIEMHRIKVAAEMILVAVGAVLVGIPRVQPPFLVDVSGNSLVAVQALGIADALGAQLMAIRTAGKPLQLRVPVDQLARRQQLRPDRQRPHGQHKGRQQQSSQPSSQKVICVIGTSQHPAGSVV